MFPAATWSKCQYIIWLELLKCGRQRFVSTNHVAASKTSYELLRSIANFVFMRSGDFPKPLVQLNFFKATIQVTFSRHVFPLTATIHLCKTASDHSWLTQINYKASIKVTRPCFWNVRFGLISSADGCACCSLQNTKSLLSQWLLSLIARESGLLPEASSSPPTSAIVLGKVVWFHTLL